MIPLRLTLREFLSYERAVLDFSSLHTACICGENGAGKSSLFEALTWALWGQTRVPVEQDLIRQGASEMQVELIYGSFDRVYRVLRSRHSNGSGTLEWQIQAGDRWRSLTQKGMRATQQAIQSQLRLDYETFVNSAYLRQGRADEFTLKRPGDRKRILAEILNLGRYETLAEQCRERGRVAKAQYGFQQQQLQQLSEQLRDRERIQAEYEHLQTRQAEVSAEQDRLKVQLEQVEERDRQQQVVRQQVEWQQQQLDTLKTALQRTERQWRQRQQEVRDLAESIDRADDIERRHQDYCRLVARERELQAQLQHHRSLTEEIQTLKAQLAERHHERSLATETLKAQLDPLRASIAADEAIVADRDRILAAATTYRQAQASLTRLDRLQATAAPLMEQQRRYQRQLQQEQDRLLARQETLHQQVERHAERDRQRQRTQQAVAEVSLQLDELAKLRVYHLRVQEKQQERRTFIEQLQARQRVAQQQWQQLDDRLHQLEAATDRVCPTCDRPLDDDSHHNVIIKHQTERETWADELWTIREQLAVSDRELALFDDEETQVATQLAGYEGRVQERGRLQAHLETSDRQSEQLVVIQTELQNIERTLSDRSFASDLRAQLAEIERALAELNYDEKDHALCRSETHRWRWAALKQSECHKARHRLAKSREAISQLEAKLVEIDQPDSEIVRAIAALNAQHASLEGARAALNYDETLHACIRQKLTSDRQAQSQWEALQRAREYLPALREDCDSLKHTLQQQRHSLHDINQRLERDRHTLSALDKTLADLADLPTATALRASLQSGREELDRVLAQRGATQQRLQHLEALTTQHRELHQECQQTRRQVQVYRELARAYGHNGIPAAIVESALPELEAEANRILGQLTASQLHLHFITQRSGKRQGQTIDTLDIAIADPRGSRPYETYSGGEAFRINFAIRLALSRLMMQRAGTRLQTLLIDEGFGTQDRTGRELLVSSINAVASDFACLLAITHLPALRDRFPSRIQVRRTERGSTLEVLA